MAGASSHIARHLKLLWALDSLETTESVFRKTDSWTLRKVPGPDKMEDTINFAIHNAFAKLSLSPQLADQMLTHLWRPTTPPITLNLEKLNRQQAQRLESMAKGDEPDKTKLHKSFITYINNLDPDVFKSVSLVEHMEDFLQPPPAPVIPEEDEDEDLVPVNYHLREYDVGIKTHRVYELRMGVHVFVGMLGMNEFNDMIMPDYE